MKITLVMVASLNGRITKGNLNTSQWWASKEDQRHFHGLLKKAKVVVMGSRTYEASKKNIVLTLNKLRVVLTRNPKKSISGVLEFTKDTPKQLVAKLSKRGYKELLLVGGGEINSLFLKANLVDDIYLTIEPVIFGTGKLLTSDGAFNSNLKLISIKKLNHSGTLLLHYAIA